MTALLRQQQIRIDPVAVFIARAEARAVLWAAGEMTLHDAIDELWAAAVRDGLVAKHGTDHVQRILADAFAPIRDDLPRDKDDAPDLVEEETPAVSAALSTPTDDGYDGLSSTFTAACRKADAQHCARQKENRDHVSPRGVPVATLRAAEYLLQLGDLERWRKWFDAHSAQERAAILQHLEQRKRRRGK
jgi:hypothetical protein